FQIRTYFPKGRNANTVLPVYNAQKGIYEAKIGPTGSNAENNTSGVFQDFLAFADKYYSNYESHRFAKFDVYYEDNPEDIFLSLSADLGNKYDITSIVNSLFNDFLRDADRTTVIKITMTEESGAFSTLYLPIPKRLNVGGVYQQTSQTAKYVCNPDYNYKPLGYKLSYRIYYTVDNDSMLKSGSNTVPLTITMQDTQNVYKAYVVANVDDSEFGATCIVCSAIGDPFIFSRNSNTVLTSPSFSLPDTEDIIYESNSGVARFNIDIGNHPEDVLIYVNVANQIESPTYIHYSFPENSIIEVPSANDYYVFLTVVDKQGNYIGQTNSKPLSLKGKNNSKPYMNRQAGGTVYNRPHGFIDSESMVFGDFPQARLTTGNPKILNFNYYILPSTYTGNKFDKAFLESISSYKRTAHLTQSDITNSNYNLYVGDGDGQYRVIFYVEDDYENYVIQGIEGTFKHFIAEYKPVVSYASSKIKVSAVSYSKELCISPEAPTTEEFNTHPSSLTSQIDYVADINNKISIKYLEDNVWKQRTESNSSPEINATMTKNDFDDNWTYETAYSNYSSKFLKISGKFSSGYISGTGKRAIAYFRDIVFMKPVYVYSGYLYYPTSYVCNSKGWSQLINGYQIYADKPSFVHIRCCPKLLTTGKTAADIDEWEARGMELGIVYNNGSNGSYTYSDTNFEAVPSGWYYTTIVHFADGSAIMSDVQQKD
ncbi:MAG: hypothetical protein K5907_07670, partial [Treponema sp.]|nr:hypothetical protein [Treponema sp.]